MEWIKYSLVYTADSIRKFDSKSNRTADSIRYSIRTQKTIRRSLVSSCTQHNLDGCHELKQLGPDTKRIEVNWSKLTNEAIQLGQSCVRSMDTM